MRTLFHGFPAETPPPERWRELASRKLDEVEQLIERAQTMRQLLREGVDCDCTRRNCKGLEDCELESTGSGTPLPLPGHGG